MPQEQDIYLATRNPIKSFLFILFAFERCSGPLGYLFIELLKLFWIDTFRETELFLETYFRNKYIIYAKLGLILLPSRLQVCKKNKFVP